MADDIVTRLRMPICGNYDDDHPSWGPQPCSGCVEAADEIERLRKALKLMSIDMRTQLAGIKMRCKCGACN